MKKRLILVPLAVVVAIGGWSLLHKGGQPAQAAAGNAAPPVTVAQTLVRTVNDTDEFTGRLQAVDTVQVRPRVGGYVDAVSFQEGALVHKGQLLFQIDPRPYQAEVDRLSANLRQARAEQVLAQSNTDRARRLFAQHAIAREEADRQDTAAQSAAAQVGATAAALATAQLNRSFTEVRAPIDGRVSNFRVTVGNLVGTNDVLTSVVSVNPVYAYFDVDEHSFLKLDALRRAHGKPPRVLMGLANEDGFPHNGRIDFIDNQLSAGTGTIRLRAVFDNADAPYTPGLYARLQLRSDNPTPRALIDDRAVGTDLGNKFVYVVDAQHRAQYRRVDTGPLLDGLRVINDGLKAGDVVVVNGLQRVRPGVEVAPTQVSMESRSLNAANQLAGGSGGKSTVALNDAQD
jgi:RND family efflux transporter MFP subunit